MTTSLDKKLHGCCHKCESVFSKDGKFTPAGDRLCSQCTNKNQDLLNTQAKNSNTSSKLFPNPEKFSRGIVSSTIINSQTKSSISKKPLRCLFPKCGKFVGVFDIGAHFKCEHKEVPHIQTYFDARNALEFSPEPICSGRVQTMLLLDLNHSSINEMKNSDRSKSSEVPSKTNHQALLVLATKLTEHDLDEKIRNKDKNHKTKEHKDTDKWIFWLGSNISTDLSYTIAVSALDNDTRLKYFGPIAHIEDDPVEIFRNGRCLLINKFHMERMSGNFQKYLNLDIIIYPEE